MDALFRAIRAACSPTAWSRGVELVRSDAVHGTRDEEYEIGLRVSARAGMVTFAVSLYPDDEDWECECNSREEACEHVAAGIIALRQARKGGQALPSSAARGGTLRYHFSRFEGGLAFQRSIVTPAEHGSGEENEEPLRATLDAVASGRVDGPRFVATESDIAVERALGAKRRGPMDRAAMSRLLEPLSRCPDVRLEGVPIHASTEPVTLHGRVEDAQGGFVLSVRQDPGITERFSNDAVLLGDTLRMLGPSRLTGRELDDLPRGRFYPHDRVAELVTEALPSLESRIPVEILTDKLPKTGKEKPRIAIEVEKSEYGLSVLATLVYGDPPTARIDAGRLVHLSGAIPVRDETLEQVRTRQLREELGLVPGRRVELEAGDAIEFSERLERWNGELRGTAHRSFKMEAPLQASLRIAGDQIDLRFESGAPSERAGAAATAAPSAVLRAWREGEPVVSLREGGFAAVPVDWLRRFGDRVADLLAARDARGRLPSHALPDLGRLCEDLDEPPPPGLEHLRPLLEDFAGIPPADLPADLQADLRAYQRRGIDWLYFLKRAGLGALLADDMGLGKTLQALTVLDGRSLVVAPTSLLHNWRSELERFRPGLPVDVYHGSQRSLALPEGTGPHVTLTSYAILRLDVEALADVDWSCIVLDEAQNIKNPNSQVAQAAYALRGRFRIALTGTPVENRLDELWSQLHFLNRGLLGGRRDFDERYARPIADGSRETAERLRERLRPFVLRRLKAEVAPELPPRTEVVLRFELSEDERAVYSAVEAATVRPLVERLQSGGSVIEALEALLRLRQAACHSGLVPGQHAEGSSKVSLLLERVEQAAADGHKALVFSQWTSFLDCIEPHLDAAEIPFERLDGSTRQRGSVVDRFQSEDGAPVMLVSLRAGGTGLNLTAADHVFLLDPWWNPAVEDQAADRAHRIGQTRPVVVHRLIARDTLEERMLELHERKRALSDAALGGTASTGGLTREDLLTLLE